MNSTSKVVSSRNGVNAAVVLAYPVRAEYLRLMLYRSSSLLQPYVLVNGNLPPDGECTDTGLVNGTTYRYRMMAADGDGHTSAASVASRAPSGGSERRAFRALPELAPLLPKDRVPRGRPRGTEPRRRST